MFSCLLINIMLSDKMAADNEEPDPQPTFQASLESQNLGSIAFFMFHVNCKVFELLPQTLIFYFLYLCNPMS